MQVMILNGTFMLMSFIPFINKQDNLLTPEDTSSSGKVPVCWTKREPLCEYSSSVTISAYGNSASFTCTSTAANCGVAMMQVNLCVSRTTKLIKAFLLETALND